MTNNQLEAEDLTQDVFIKVYQNLKKFKGKSKLSTWIYRIAYNTCVDASRKKTVAVYSDEYGLANVSEDKTREPEEQIIHQEEWFCLKECIASLKAEYKAVIIMRDIRHLTYQEIAEILEMPLGTVKAKISRARQALKKLLVKKGINTTSEGGHNNDM
jgi:RNA polymerase sigma-70 factor (ECF subfamily)